MRAIVYCFLALIVITIFLASVWTIVSFRVPNAKGLKFDCKEWEEKGFIKFIRKFLPSFLFYLLGTGVIALNILLIFDNALWGDEAFSAITVRADIKGILEIVHYLENHPPFYYIWLRFWVVLLGRHGWVMHLASVVPFMAVVVAAMTFIRKRFGKLPAAFIMIIAGLSAPCVRYNVEIRMYALAFFAVFMAFYFSNRILDNKNYAWYGIVLASLLGAYTHYYALINCGILIVFTGIFYALKRRGKGWFKGLIALAGYIVGYIPWMKELFNQTGQVSDKWWNSSLLPVKDAVEMVGAGPSFKVCVLVLMVLFTLILVIAESGILKIKENEDHLQICVGKPGLKNLSAESYSCITGWLTIIGTIVSAYLLCIIINPILIQRYLYMLVAVSALCLTYGSYGVMKLIRSFAQKEKAYAYLHKVAVFVFVSILCMMTGIGMGDYRAFYAEFKYEKTMTENFLNYVGEPDKDVVFVSNGVSHLAWTVLDYYFPENEIIAGGIWETSADEIWYFDNHYLPAETVKGLEEKGYEVSEYGTQQIGQYPFILYHMVRRK